MPLTIPLPTGPTTTSTMVIHAARSRHGWELGVLVGYGVVVGATTFVAFIASDRIARWVGRSGFNVLTRPIGLTLAAPTEETMAQGVVKQLPIQGR